MLTYEEHLFGRIATLKRYCTAEQVNECLQLQRAAKGSARQAIGAILVSKGYLTADQLNKILAIRKAKLRRLARGSDQVQQAERDFRRFVLREGTVSFEDLEAAVLEQQRLHQRNINVTIWEVLVSQGLMDIAQVLRVLTVQNNRNLVCPNCDYYFRIISYSFGTTYRCTKCQGMLREPLSLDYVNAEAVLETRCPESEITTQNNDQVEVI